MEKIKQEHDSDDQTKEDLKNAESSVSGEKQKTEELKESVKQNQNDQILTKSFLLKWTAHQYQKEPFNLTKSLALEVAQYFAKNSSYRFLLHPEELLENLCGFYADRSQSKTEFQYYKRIQNTVGKFNDLCMALINFYASNPDQYRKIQEEMSDDLSMLDISARMVQPLRNNFVFDDDDVPF